MLITTLKIDGMMCGMCESHINSEIRKNFDVKKVTSSHKKGITEIVSEMRLDKSRLREVIAQTGYELCGITSEQYKKKGLFGR